MASPIVTTGRPEIPWSQDRYGFDQWVYNTVLQLQDALVPLSTPTNLRATAMAGAIQIDFTRSDADSYRIFWNTVPSINGANLIDVGNSNKYVDVIGADGVKRYFAVQGQKGQVVSPYSGWVSATTLTLTTTITPPEPPASIETPTQDTSTASVSGVVGSPGQLRDL